jgi:uncharacterized protein (TIGR02145 family)
LFSLSFMLMGWASLPAFAQAQTGQTYWLGRLDGTEYVFDTPLPPDFAAKILAADANKWVIDKTPREFPSQNVNGTEYSFVKTPITYDKPMFDQGQVALVRKPGKSEMLWLDGHLNSTVGEPLARQLPAPKAGEWTTHDLVILISPNAETRVSIFGGQERYWLGRPDGTDYVFDTPLPPDFAAAIIAADAKQFVIDKTPREFPPQNVDGTAYSFVKTQIAYDKPQFDRGELGLVGVDGWRGADWIDAHLNSAVGEPLARQLSVPKAGEWKTHDMLILISPNAKTPALRVPIPEMALAKLRMNELGQQTQAGLYYPTVKAPADLDAFRAQMLAYGNAGRRDPDFRKYNGAKTATDLSGDTVQTMKGTEKVFKHNQTPPYFNDHVLNNELNQMAQFQAEYTALNRITDITMHDGPTSYTDPKTGKSGTMYGLGDRAKFFGVSAMTVEGGAGQHELGSAPHVWMAGDTHFRPWFNVSGCQDQVGYGAAQDKDGKWYFIVVATADTDPDCVNVPVQPTTEATAQATPAATAEATAGATPEATPEATTEPTADATPEPTVAATAQPTAAPALADRFPLRPGQTVERDRKIPSESGDHYLLFQPDGNVVVYTADDKYAWGLESVTDKFAQAQSVKMEPDGNFVVRDVDDKHIWSALTANPDASAYLTLTPAGVLRLVSGATGATLWASDGDLSPVAPTVEPTAEATAEPTPEATAEPAAAATAEATGEATAETAPQATAEAPATVTDADGNVYPTVRVGDQLWMAENLRTTTCSDGAAIPLVSDQDVWVTQTAAAYTWGRDVAGAAQAEAEYGALYNAYAAALPCNVCPSGWRVPSQADFQTLLDGQGADAHLKLSDPASWGPDSQATNASGWSARPAGGAGGDTPGSYDFGQYAYFWSATPNTGDTNFLMVIHGADAGANGIAGLRYGFSIRCVQDLPPAQTAAPALQATLVITGHAQGGKALWAPWSPDGSKLVAASVDNSVQVWDATTGASLATLTGHTAHVRKAAWSPDGSKLAAASDDGTVRVWDAATGASLATLTGHTSVDDVAWSPDGSKLASASALADGIILVWDVATGTSLATLTGHTHYLQSMAWSPDGSKLASASSDQTVRVWDATTGASLVTITNNNSLGTSVAWSPDGSKLAAGFGNDGDIGVWDATTGASLATLTGHTDHVGDVAWSACSAFGVVTCALASASDDGTVRVWDATTGASLTTFTGHTGGAGKVAWSPDGSKLASTSARSGGDETVRIWDVATGASLAALTGHTGAPAEVAWSPDGSKLVSEGDGTLRVWAEVTPPAGTPADTSD